MRLEGVLHVGTLPEVQQGSMVVPCLHIARCYDCVRFQSIADKYH